MPNPENASYFPRGTNSYVANLQYHSEVNTQALARVIIPAVTVSGVGVSANSATGLFNALSIAAAGSGIVPTSTEYTVAMQTQDGVGGAKYGRNLQIVASGASAVIVTVKGRDYLGQPMTESFTLNGATPVIGKKAFKFVDSITNAASAVTINLGWAGGLGLPFWGMRLNSEMVGTIDARSPPGTAGTYVPGNFVPSNGLDPRGLYTPNSAPNGINVYDLLIECNKTNIYGIAHI